MHLPSFLSISSFLSASHLGLKLNFWKCPFCHLIRLYIRSIISEVYQPRWKNSSYQFEHQFSQFGSVVQVLDDYLLITNVKDLICNLKRLHTQFTSEHEGLNISIFNLTKLRPGHCVPAGSSGTHNVCVCVHHENVKLMLNEINV